MFSLSTLLLNLSYLRSVSGSSVFSDSNNSNLYSIMNIPERQVTSYFYLYRCVGVFTAIPAIYLSFFNRQQIFYPKVKPKIFLLLLSDSFIMK